MIRVEYINTLLALPGKKRDKKMADGCLGLDISGRRKQGELADLLLNIHKFNAATYSAYPTN